MSCQMYKAVRNIVGHMTFPSLRGEEIQLMNVGAKQNWTITTRRIQLAVSLDVQNVVQVKIQDVVTYH